MSGVDGLPRWGDPNEKNAQGYYIRDERGEPDAPHERVSNEYPRNSFQEQLQRQPHAQNYGSFQQPRQASFGEAGSPVQTAYPMHPERPKTPRTLAKEAYKQGRIDGKTVKESSNIARKIRNSKRYRFLIENGVDPKIAYSVRQNQEKYEYILSKAQGNS